VALILYGLVDSTAFYCSCEQVFRPDLSGKPIIVLSNNDSCVVSLTQQAKDLGIRMGDPLFTVKAKVSLDQVFIFSSNHALYADMSKRMYMLLCQEDAEVEQYSIDESFLRFTISDPIDEDSIYALRQELEIRAIEIRKRIKQTLGIPVRVSIAETKTLAKVGSVYAKHLLNRGKDPCICLWKHPEQISIQVHTPIEEVWGIGSRLSIQLRERGICNAFELSQADPEMLKRISSIQLMRTGLELRGCACISFSSHITLPSRMIRSRMFGRPLHSLKIIQQALAVHVSYLADMLRYQKRVPRTVFVWLEHKGYGAGRRVFSSRTVSLSRPTSKTPDLIAIASVLLNDCWKEKSTHGSYMYYSKVGVCFGDIIPRSENNASLFEKDSIVSSQVDDMYSVFDSINKKYGRHTIVFGSLGLPHALKQQNVYVWSTKKTYSSPQYTTSWNDIMRVK